MVLQNIHLIPPICTVMSSPYCFAHFEVTSPGNTAGIRCATPMNGRPLGPGGYRYLEDRFLVSISAESQIDIHGTTSKSKREMKRTAREFIASVISRAPYYLFIQEAEFPHAPPPTAATEGPLGDGPFRPRRMVRGRINL